MPASSKKARLDSEDYSRKGYRQSGKSSVGKAIKLKQKSNSNTGLSGETKDPFQRLDDVAISQIFQYLSPKNTETVRRVSKHWKSISEFFCGRGLFQQHYKHVEPMIDRCTTREASNLLFRRTRKYIVLDLNPSSKFRSRHYLLTAMVNG